MHDTGTADGAVRNRVLDVRKLGVIIVVASLAVLLVLSPAVAKSKFRITSPAFESGQPIPDGFTCSGENASPPLKWRGVPAKTKELALTMLDPDAPIGTVTHWVAWGIDPKTRALPEQTLPPNVVQGANITGRAAYLGPCPPPDGLAHRYRFTLYALSEPLALTSGASLDEFKTAVDGITLAKARLVGRYARTAENTTA